MEDYQKELDDFVAAFKAFRAAADALGAKRGTSFFGPDLSGMAVQAGSVRKLFGSLDDVTITDRCDDKYPIQTARVYDGVRFHSIHEV